MAEAMQVEQVHGAPLAAGQGRDGPADPAGDVRGFRSLGRPGRAAGGIRHYPEDLPAHLPQPPPGHVQRDAAEPGAEPVGGPEPAQVGHRGDGCLLGGVSGQVRRSQNSLGQEDGRVPVPAHQFGERFSGAAQGILHQIGM
jgi:hypothetical protein